MIALFVVAGIIILRWFGEFLLLAINYHYYWKEYRCRLEPWTNEMKRRAKRWWPLLIADTALHISLAVCLFYFFPATLPLWAKITSIILAAIVAAFYAWWLLHLGGFAMRAIRGWRSAKC